MNEGHEIIVRHAAPEPRVGVAVGYAVGAVDIRIAHGPGQPASVARLGLDAADELLRQLATAIGRGAALHNDIAADAAAALDRVVGHA